MVEDSHFVKLWLRALAVVLCDVRALALSSIGGERGSAIPRLTTLKCRGERGTAIPAGANVVRPSP